MGKVYLIGAGPGDPGLYTLKAREIIKIADVIVYDYLANEVFLDWIKKGCEVIYAGKQGGSHTLPQGEINKLLVDLSKKYEVVVRLKGGDPYVFGRGGEEAEFLVDNQVEFEVVPGVTSAIAASAYAGIPLTHRDFSSSVTFITGHEADSKKESVIDWKAIANSASTLVFFMGVKNLPIITKNLIDAGMDRDMPCALIRWGTTCKQKTLVSKVCTISKDAKEAQIKPPALLVVGKVVELRDKLLWFEKKPLLGKNIVITRARSQASELVNLLRKLGGCCIQFPTIEITEMDDYTDLFKEFDRLSVYDWIVFTSVNGVDYFFRNLIKKGLDTRSLCNIMVCAIGPATKKRLERYGIVPDMVPKRYVAESIVEEFKTHKIKGKKILIPRAYKAREVLVDELEKLGADVKVIPVYKTVMSDSKVDVIIEKIEKREIDYITFTSSSTVKNFFSMVSPQIVSNYGANIKFACIGPITAKTLQGFGFSAHIVPKSYTISDLVNAIILYESENKKVHYNDITIKRNKK